MIDSMVDNIIFSRSWQDSEFFQIQVECISDLITVRGEIYSSSDYIDDLVRTINLFLVENVNGICWQNGTKGDGSTSCMALTFYRKDDLGHISIEVYMEIDDGGRLCKHNCCFYVNTEYGLLYQFRDNLQKLKVPKLGDKVSLIDSQF